MAKINNSKNIYSQLEEVINKLDEMVIENKELLQTIRELEKSLAKKDAKILELILEIERLKNNNNKNSSNSSKPSSTNGFKKVILNNREKSNRKRGGQPNHKGVTLTKKDIDKMIENGDIDEVKTVIKNKTEKNKHLKPIIRYELDVKIVKKITKYVIYPSEQTNIIGSPVIYGNNIKSIVNVLSMKYLSIDAIAEFISEVTHGIVNLSKGTIYEWNKDISDKLNDIQIEKIKQELLNSLVLHVDESPIKVDGKQYYVHNISNGKYTLQFIAKTRGMKAVEEFGFLKDFKGILVHDHFIMYFNYGIDNAECNVHILRYLKGIEENTKHKWATKMKEFLKESNKNKEKLLRNGCNGLSKKEYESYKQKYLDILKEGHNEYLKDRKNNAFAKDETNLLNRMKNYAHNHLLFLERFDVPFSNNRAEADLRPVKIRQKIGKFRSEDGAKNYIITRSCYSTFKKNNINPYDAINSILAEEKLQFKIG